MKNYYEILEVNKKASKEVIEKAYKVLVKKYHPDLQTGTNKKYAEEKIKEINEAYSVLTDQFMKEQYDIELEKQEQEALYRKYEQQQNVNTQNTNQNNYTSNINNTNSRNSYSNKAGNSKASNNEWNAKNGNRSKTRNNQNRHNIEAEELNEKMSKYKVGSFSGIIALCKELYKNKPKRDEIKEVTKKDIIALILTIIVVILIGVALWFIPFTNGWMRQLLFENPLFNAIGSLFNG